MPPRSTPARTHRPARRSRARERRRGQPLGLGEATGAFGGSVDAAERLHAQRELGHRPHERDRVRASARRPALRRPAGRRAPRGQERRAAGDAVRDGHGRFLRRARPDRHRPASRTSRATASSTSTRPAPPAASHNRISRFTANGDVAAAGSEIDLVDLPTLSSATNHNGGGMHFGIDGKLYVGVGENANAAQAQNLRTRSASCCASTRTAPSRATTRSSRRRAAWRARSGPTACATRSPSRCSRAPAASTSTTSARTPGRRSTSARAGANYGWPSSEGPDNVGAGMTAPLFAYSTATPTRPARARAASSPASRSPAARSIRRPVPFPAGYRDQYYFADFVSHSSAASTRQRMRPMRSRAFGRAGRPAGGQRRRALRADAQQRDADHCSAARTRPPTADAGSDRRAERLQAARAASGSARSPSDGCAPPARSPCTRASPAMPSSSVWTISSPSMHSSEAPRMRSLSARPAPS